MNKKNSFSNEHQATDINEAIERRFAEGVPVNIYELANGFHRSVKTAAMPANSPNVIYRATVNFNCE